VPSAAEVIANPIRSADAATLAAALTSMRRTTLQLFDAWRAALAPTMDIRYAPELNPPRWELGHVGWFEEYWIARNPARLLGPAANPDVARAASQLRGADALYHSGRVAHTSRWHLDLPDADRTLDYVARVRARTLALLADAPPNDAALYFFRWALMHEAMHAEAAVYMAQHLALDIHAALEVAGPTPAGAVGDWNLPGGAFRLGRGGAGFAFDNELGAHEVELAPFAIARAPVTWGEFRAFVEAGGYEQEPLWTAEGWAWRQRQGAARPRYLMRADGAPDGAWQRAAFGRWVTPDDAEPVQHVTRFEAEAWCRWAGRRLPTEAEWECAAVTAAASGEPFDWGQIWEWTASPFVPYPGFEPHPYRDYSMPWFDGRPVLRGASWATPAVLRDARFRNYFPADRSDVIAGFRTCAP
jgi:ergothioneine biosynthesis protein EgtB